MVPRENLEESVVRTGRDFPAGGNPCPLARLKKLGELLLLFQLDLISCKEPRDIVFIQELIQLGEICFNDCINLSNK